MANRAAVARPVLLHILGLRGVGIAELARRVWAEINDTDVFGLAAQLAFYFLFALFPLFIFIASLVAYLPIQDLIPRVIEIAEPVLPNQGALDLVRGTVDEIVKKSSGGLLSFGLLASLWASSAGIAAIAGALNCAYEVGESRPYWKVRLMAILLTIGLSLLIIVAMALLMFGDHIGAWIAARAGLGVVFSILWTIGRWAVILLFLLLAIGLVYYFAPDVEQDWRWITPGSVFAVAVWIIASIAFRIYIANFADYSATYGSLGAMIVLMLWFYITGFVIIVGGEINAEIERASRMGKNIMGNA